LRNVFGAGQVAQGVGAEVDERDIGRKLFQYKGFSDAGQDGLAHPVFTEISTNGGCGG
jgi:hypothetical protein